MRRFVVQCYWQVSAEAIVEVEDNEGLDDAIEKVQSCEYGLPEEPDYVDGSFEVERDLCREIDGEPGVKVSEFAKGPEEDDFGPGEEAGP